MNYDPEAHLDALVTFLRYRFQPYLDQRSKPDLPLGTIIPENVIPGGMWPIPTLTADQPAIEVAIPQQVVQGFDLYQTAGQESLTVALRAWQQEYGDVATATERVYRKSLRMQAALLTGMTARDENVFGDNAVPLDVRSSWRADPTTDQRESYTSSLTMVVTVDGSGQIR